MVDGSLDIAQSSVVEGLKLLRGHLHVVCHPIVECFELSKTLFDHQLRVTQDLEVRHI